MHAVLDNCYWIVIDNLKGVYRDKECASNGGFPMHPDVENDEFGKLLNEAFPEIHDFGKKFHFFYFFID